MNKRVSAFLLSVILCLSLAGTAFAAEAAETPKINISSVSARTDTVVISASGLEANKSYLGTVSVIDTSTNQVKADTTPVIFNAKTDMNGAVQPFEVAAPPLSGGEKISVILAAGQGVDDIVPATAYVPGSSSGSGTQTTTYSSGNVTVNAMTNGKVTISPSNPAKGAKVTLTVTPDKGYRLDKLTVRDKDGKEIELTKVDENTYTFIMPDGKVTVDATFVLDDGMKFTDVPRNAYYYDAVLWAIQNGITQGTSATTFSPESSCTRAQMVTFLWRAAGSPSTSGVRNPFTDVRQGTYYYDAVLWAVANGVTRGTSATTFSPDEAVTRGQTVTFIYRAKGFPAPAGQSNFTDVAADAYYAVAVNWAVGAGVTNGTSAATFSPNVSCTRGQIVTFLYRSR